MPFETIKDIWWRYRNRPLCNEDYSGKLDEPPEALSIGILLGGSSLATAAWDNALTALTRVIAGRRQGLSSPLNVNVVFQVPGQFLKPEFEGVRMGTYWKRYKALVVQVAVPEELPDDVWADVLTRLSAAIDEAEGWAQKKGIAENLDSLRDFVKRLDDPAN